MSYAPASPDLSSFYSGSADSHNAGHHHHHHHSSSSGCGFPVQVSSSNPRSRPLSPPHGLTLPGGPTSSVTTNYQANRVGEVHFSLHSNQQHHHHLHTPYHEHPYSLHTPISPQPNSSQAVHAQNHLHYIHSPFQAQKNIQSLQIVPPSNHNINTSQPGPSPIGLQYIPPYSAQQYKSEPDDAFCFSSVQEIPQRDLFPQQPHRRSYSQPHSDATRIKSEVKSEEQYGVHSPQNIRIKSETQPSYPLPEAMPPRRSAAAAQPSVIASPVKTRFPTARIKRIMQADEEVGKVAQQTPIAVGKALEMFMVALVSKSHDVAKDKGAKRVTAQHLKQVIESDDQWDFLREIVGRISETEEKAGRAGGRAKAESSSDEEVPEPKKKGRGGRKKKVT
ncbi:hypothetical protein MCOR27_002396 [Pyricularia oryzae]|nr:hypothetical protein MCOR27_002396 [Pyricularia oryzae]KAI6325909.1 hypothetical protein MCOR29_003615 [Pyricularia oryzae]KAI6401669.1 hypothetical protein MCOR20_007951 [Pyricularia oryzae]KAI6435094.1 hypothetical protein MCOR21_001932 [Pyricularia oryzae]KAI6450169.1 hypothetical protein MCOR22_001982 [Pyricularia oryzae]